jgi:hypothetical protein
MTYDMKHDEHTEQCERIIDDATRSWSKYRRIIDDAVRTLPPSRLKLTNLYLDTQEYKEGAPIGPAPQGIKAKHSCLVVFVDENPRANFSHECRYRFYDPGSQEFLYQTRAQFPPWVNYVPETFGPIYEPVQPAKRDGGPHHEQRKD